MAPSGEEEGIISMKIKAFFIPSDYIKSFVLSLLILCFAGVEQVSAAWNGESLEQPETVKIEGKTFYLIKNEAQLAWFAGETNKKSGQRLNINAKLDADLDMGGKLWTPIAAGKGDRKFTGIIDGDNHIISNMYISGAELAQINSVYAQNVGFVAVLGNKGTVKNIVFENVEINASTNAGSILSSTSQQISVGAVVGWLADGNPGGTVSGCYVSGKIETSGKGQGVGGIVGNAKNGTIENCMSAVSIEATGNDAFVGGIVGITKSTLTVKSCAYDGENLSNAGNGATGAIVGNHLSGTLTTSNNYYEEYVEKGVGKGSELANTNEKTEDVNTAEIACKLNNGTMLDGVCDKDSPWSVGEKTLALNGYGAAMNMSVTSINVMRFGAVTITEYPDRTVAEIDGEYTGEDAVEISQDIHVDEIQLNRTFTVGRMTTLMLPFSIDTSKVKGCDIYRFKRIVEKENSWSVRLSYITTDYLGANTPYLVMPNESTITFEGDAIFNTETAPVEVLTSGAWEFKGVYAYTTFNDHPDLGNVYSFAAQERNGARVGQFVEMDAEATMTALNAYLVKHQSQGFAKTFGGSLNKNPAEIDVEIVDENDNVIETGKMNPVTGEIRMDRWFDMKGRKLNAKPTTRGMYYHNGKRVIVE